MDRWQALADRALQRSTRRSGGAWQRYELQPGVERELAELVALEGECCSFLRFELTRVDGALELEIHGPEQAALLLDAFATGSRPLPA